MMWFKLCLNWLLKTYFNCVSTSQQSSTICINYLQLYSDDCLEDNSATYNSLVFVSQKWISSYLEIIKAIFTHGYFPTFILVLIILPTKNAAKTAIKGCQEHDNKTDIGQWQAWKHFEQRRKHHITKAKNLSTKKISLPALILTFFS